MIPDILKLEGNKVSNNLSNISFYFYGDPGTWKTTTSTSWPNTLLAATEIGFRFIPDVKAVVLNSWADFRALVRQLKTPAAKKMYDRIAIDTATPLFKWAEQFVVNAHPGATDLTSIPWGKGWVELREQLELFKDLTRYGYAITFITHAKTTEYTEKVEGEDGQVVEVDKIKVKTELDKTAFGVVSKLVDFAFYLRKELDDDGVYRVYAYHTIDNGVDTKTRLPKMRNRILFTYDEITKAINEAIEANGFETTTDALTDALDIEPFANIKNTVIELYKQFLDTDYEEKATDLIQNFVPEGEKLSTMGENYRGSLIAAREALLDLAQEINGQSN